jgi:hypothetical protein
MIGCCNPEIIGSVPNTLRPQETINRCRAAVTQMPAVRVGKTVSQCDVAHHRLIRHITDGMNGVEYKIILSRIDLEFILSL